MKKIALILWYWIFEIENIQYKTYLDKVWIILEESNFDEVIFCGWKTRVWSDISESGSMANYIKTRNKAQSNIICEENSFTTYENITFAKEKIRLDKDISITIICDSIRVPKVICYALREFQNYSQEEIIWLLSSDLAEVDILNNYTIELWGIQFQWIAMERTKKELADQIVWSLIQSHYCDYPNLNKQFVNYRSEKWGFWKNYFDKRNK